MARKKKGTETEGDGAQAPEEAARKGPPKSVWREYFESAIYTAIMFVFFITFIGRTVGVPTGSMQNTIYIGDHFLINKFIFAPGSAPFFLPKRAIRRGDIIVFKYPGDRDNPGRDEMSVPPVRPYVDYFIKRVVGLPGETIELRGALVLIDGQPLPEHRVKSNPGKNSKAPLDIVEDTPLQPGESYKVYHSPRILEDPQMGATEKPPEIFHYAVEKPYKIPEGHYFVMGDNREDSADSRAWGPVSGELVIGRALFVFWSRDETDPSSNILTNTRWWRTFTMIK